MKKQARIALGIVMALLIFAIAAKPLQIVFSVVAIFALSMVTDSQRVFYDVEALMSIVGFVAALGLALLVYRRVTRGGAALETAASSQTDT